MTVSQTIRSFFNRAARIDKSRAMDVGAVLGAVAAIQSVETKGFKGFLKAALVGVLGCVAGMAVGLGLMKGLDAISASRLGSARA